MEVDPENLRDKISWWRISFGQPEVQRLQESVNRECISQGPVTEQFEAEIAEKLNVPYVVVTTSGSVAMLMALMAKGIGRDDEVIIPDRNWIATAHAALLLGAKVILVDVKRDRPILDVSLIKSKISSRTKAIIPVHLNGRSVDMEAVQKIASDYHLYILEDACQALFSRNAKGFLGTQSDAGCFSLGVTKLISTGQGGFVVTRNQETYEKLKLIRNHGVVDLFTDTWNQFGFNFKFTDLLSSFGLAQLTRVSSRIEHVKDLYMKYIEGIADLPYLDVVPVNVSDGELPLYVAVISENRESLIQFLGSKGIQARAAPPSIHISTYIENDGNFPNSIMFDQRKLYLPCGPEQPIENIPIVINALKSFGKQ